MVTAPAQAPTLRMQLMVLIEADIASGTPVDDAIRNALHVVLDRGQAVEFIKEFGYRAVIQEWREYLRHERERLVGTPVEATAKADEAGPERAEATPKPKPFPQRIAGQQTIPDPWIVRREQSHVRTSVYDQQWNLADLQWKRLGDLTYADCCVLAERYRKRTKDMQRKASFFDFLKTKLEGTEKAVQDVVQESTLRLLQQKIGAFDFDSDIDADAD